MNITKNNLERSKMEKDKCGVCGKEYTGLYVYDSYLDKKVCSSCQTYPFKFKRDIDNDNMYALSYKPENNI